MVVLLNFLVVHQLRYADLIAQVLFVLYNIVCMVSFHGQTIGKKIAQLSVNTSKLIHGSVLEVGPRELFKIIYFTPFIGIPALVINLIVFLKTGKMLEDYVSKTTVTFERRLSNDAKS